MKGAMRCVSCGNMLKTPEEQSESIKKLESFQKRSAIKKFVKFIVFLSAAGLVYYYYDEEILRMIHKILSH
jgi:uncharacterized UPF0160 family protein